MNLLSLPKLDVLMFLQMEAYAQLGLEVDDSEFMKSKIGK
jgi:hypothetical protein